MSQDLDRELAVILHADIVGSTNLVQQDEAVANQRFRSAFDDLSAGIRDHGGIVREVRGDALVATFPRESDAGSSGDS